MYDRILFPTDGSETASSVLDHAIEVASAHRATVHVVHVVEAAPGDAGRSEQPELDGERIVADAAARATRLDVPVETEVLRGDPDEAIVEYGERIEADLVVMATHGREGVERFLMGSVTERVVNASTAPVLTVTPGENGTFVYPPADVLVPTDGSEGADRALHEAADLAAATGATLHLLHVVETAHLGVDVRSAAASDRLEERAEEILATARESAESAAVDAIRSSIAHGSPIREIHTYLEETEVDMVVLGTRGRTDFSRYVLGGVSAKLVRTSPVPVLLTRNQEGDRAADGPS